MRRRITFIQHPDAPFTPDQAVLTPDALSIRDLDALREERLTFSYDEFTSDLWQVLKHNQQLHIRWATEQAYDTLAPFSSRISPGLHVFLTPGEEDNAGGEAEALLCPWLKKAFGDAVDCLSPAVSFTSPPILSKRFSSTANLHYHTLLSSPDNLVTFIQQTICNKTTGDKAAHCQDYAASLLSADSIDIGYDSIAHAMTVSAVWNAAPGNGWTDTIKKPDGKTDQIEVGLLGSERAADPEDIKMGGLLGVVGRDEELKPTLFSFPSRHHPLPRDASYSVSFPHPTGLHPTLTLSLPRASLEHPPAPPDTTCALHTYLTLPSTIFGDKYQLSTTDPLFLQSHNLAALRAVFGETDLEAPDWAVDPWGSNWLFELATPDESKTLPDELNVTIPLHLRYLRPSESGYRTAEMPWPVVFWACTAEEGSKMGINPFDRVSLGWDGLFGPRTMFYQLHPSPSPSSSSSGGDGRLVEKLQVPVLQLNENEGIFRSKTIELGTVAVIILGFGWVLWKLGLVVRSSGKTKNEKEAEKKTE